jgi:hypothetical protein
MTKRGLQINKKKIAEKLLRYEVKKILKKCTREVV